MKPHDQTKPFVSLTGIKTSLFLILSLCHNFSLGQNEVSTYSLQNCYQLLLGQENDEYNVLSGLDLWFNFNENSWPDYVQFITEDFHGNINHFDVQDYVDAGLLKDPFGIGYSPDGYDNIVVGLKALTEGGVFAKNIYTFRFKSDVKKATIRVFNETDNPVTLDLDRELTLNFMNLSEAFLLKPGNDESCLTFENFNVNLENSLDGFCGKTKASLWQVPPIKNAQNQIDPIKVELGINQEIEIENDWCNNCMDATANPSEPDPVPCGCTNFMMNITITPCQGHTMPDNCPSLEFQLPVTVCCVCDVRTTIFD